MKSKSTSTSGLLQKLFGYLLVAIVFGGGIYWWYTEYIHSLSFDVAEVEENHFPPPPASSPNSNTQTAPESTPTLPAERIFLKDSQLVGLTANIEPQFIDENTTISDENIIAIMKEIARIERVDPNEWMRLVFVGKTHIGYILPNSPFPDTTIMNIASQQEVGRIPSELATIYQNEHTQIMVDNTVIYSYVLDDEAISEIPGTKLTKENESYDFCGGCHGGPDPRFSTTTTSATIAVFDWSKTRPGNYEEGEMPLVPEKVRDVTITLPQ